MLYKTEIKSDISLFLLIYHTRYYENDVDVNLAIFSAVANQQLALMKILHCDWLPPKVRQVDV